MRIAWFGAGSMGRPMLTRLVRAGHEVVLTPRRPEDRSALSEIGARVEDTVAGACRGAEMVFSSLPGPREVEQVWSGPKGVLAAVAPGTIGVDTSTVGPECALMLSSSAAEAGAEMIDCPVSGGPQGAEQGTLSLFAGGESSAVDAAEPVLSVLGVCHRCGPAGTGQKAKLINQALVASTTLGVCVTYALAATTGHDKRKLLDAMTGGAADGRLLQSLWSKLLSDELSSGFDLSLMVKDLHLLREFTAASGLDATWLDSVVAVYEAATTELGPGHGTQALGSYLQRKLAAER